MQSRTSMLRLSANDNRAAGKRGLEQPARIAFTAAVARRETVVRSVWAACLAVAGLNHARILLQHGLFWDYGGVGWLSAAYWSSLTLLDPLIAALLFLRPAAGVPATVALITTNVAHNLAVTYRFAPEGAFVAAVASSPVLLSQVGFLLFVVASWSTARRT